MQDLVTIAERPWHAETVEAALEGRQSSPAGLTSAEAARRLEADGPNRLPAGKPRSLWARVFAQFNNLLIYVLLASALVTVLLRHALDAVVILAVVLINATIGFIQEGRAENALAAIRAMLTREASVLRDGRRLTVPAESLALGDVVLIEAGDRVPADLRLLRASNLRIEEAALTGESAPADKSTDPVAPEAALGDRASMAYSGTLVASGQGAGLVVATSALTELGRISAMVGDVESLTTPLLRQMDAFARSLTIVILAVAAGVGVFAAAARGYEIEQAFMAAVGVAVSAIPEGLPAVMTITLAIGVKRMAERNAIIRRLPAVETLGAVSTICSDKTGTLTLNQMTVGAVVTASGTFETTGNGYEPRGVLLCDGGAIDPAAYPELGAIAQAALLCNDASLRQVGAEWVVDGDPMEGALIAFAIKAGADPEALKRESPRLKEIPFDSRHRFMATLNHVGAKDVITVKGAPERVLELCGSQRSATGDELLAAQAWRGEIDRLAGRGQRVIAFASKPARGAGSLEFDDVDAGGLTLIGLVWSRRSAAAGSGSGDRRMQGGGDRRQDDHRRSRLDRGGDRARARPGRGDGRRADRPRHRRDGRRGAAPRAADHVGVRAHQPRAQAETGRGAAGGGRGRVDDRRRRQRRAGAQARRRRRRHGPQGHGSRQGGGGDGAGGRQFRHHRRRRARGPHRLRQSGQGGRLGAADQWRPGDGDRRRRPPRRQHADDAGANLMGEHGHRRDAGACVRLRSGRARRDGAGAARSARADPLEPARVADGAGVGAVLRRGVRGLLLGAQARRGDRARADLRRQCDGRTRDRLSVQRPASAHAAPFDFRAIRLTRALAIGIGAVVVLQILFTYLPPLEILYDTRPIDWPDMGVAALAAIGLILVLELEKAVRIGLFGAARA